MSATEVTTRYAAALHELARANDSQEAVISELRELKKVFEDSEIKEFIESPIIKPELKATVVEKALESAKLSQEVKNFILLLAKKDRLALYGNILDAFQAESDEAHGVTRGVVRSAAVLSPEERLQVEEIVAQATKKQVILTYKEDPNVIGGLVAQVGSYSFDDTLTGHLRRLKEELKRRTH